MGLHATSHRRCRQSRSSQHCPWHWGRVSGCVWHWRIMWHVWQQPPRHVALWLWDTQGHDLRHCQASAKLERSNIFTITSISLPIKQPALTLVVTVIGWLNGPALSEYDNQIKVFQNDQIRATNDLKYRRHIYTFTLTCWLVSLDRTIFSMPSFIFIINRPRAHLFGHNHDTPGVEIRDGIVFSNAAMPHRPQANVIHYHVHRSHYQPGHTPVVDCDLHLD